MEKIGVRKALLALLFSTFLAGAIVCGGHAVFADEAVSVSINGEILEFDVPPTIINGSTMVPMRAIFEALGASVSWDNTTKTAEGVKDDVTVRITIGSEVLLKNNSAIVLNSPAVIINSNTFVPTRAIAESFGCDVDWDGGTKTVYIYTVKDNTETREHLETADEYGEPEDMTDEYGEPKDMADEYGEPGDVPDEQFD